VAAGLYLLLLPLWWYSLEALVVLLVTPADWIYHSFNRDVRIQPDGKVVRVVMAVAGGEPVRSGLRLDTITYGLPMFAALALATRADSIRAKARALGLGLAAMLVLTVPAVMMWASLSGMQVEESLSPLGGPPSKRSSFFYYAFHGYAFSQPVVAALLWIGFLMLGLFKEKPKPEVVAVARNSPCPCGSGRKYKRCCGRA
jgi:hypothetical protein